MDKKRAKELLKNETELRQAAEAAFKKMDIDNSGWLSKTEIEVALKMYLLSRGEEPSAEDIDTVFGQLDKNHDGKISLKEFIDMTKAILKKI